MDNAANRLLALLGAALVVGTIAVFALADRHHTSSPAKAGPAVATTKIVIRDFNFTPATATVKAGAKITVLNSDNASHTLTTDSGPKVDTGGLDRGKSKVVVFTKPGTYAYHCDFHAYMKGTVTVR